MKPTVMLYNIKNKKILNSIKMQSVKIGFRIRLIEEESYSIPLLFLAAGVTEPTGEPEEEDFSFDDPMMVFAAFPDAKLNMFLNQYRAARLPQINLKAMITEQNSNWNSKQLRDELLKEHEAMSKMNQQGEK